MLSWTSMEFCADVSALGRPKDLETMTFLSTRLQFRQKLVLNLFVCGPGVPNFSRSCQSLRTSQFGVR
jgi:hypothetical protein